MVDQQARATDKLHGFPVVFPALLGACLVLGVEWVFIRDSAVPWEGLVLAGYGVILLSLQFMGTFSLSVSPKGASARYTARKESVSTAPKQSKIVDVS